MMGLRLTKIDHIPIRTIFHATKWRMKILHFDSESRKLNCSGTMNFFVLKFNINRLYLKSHLSIHIPNTYLYSITYDVYILYTLQMMGYARSRDYPQCGCSVHRTRNERFGVLFLSGMCGSVWGILRRLRGPYVNPRTGVPRHIYF